MYTISSLEIDVLGGGIFSFLKPTYGGVFDFTAAEVAATKAATTCTTNETEAPPTTFRPTIRFTTAATVI